MPAELIPIVLFVCIAYAIKVLAEARVRSRMIGESGADELLRATLLAEQQRRRHASLQWGVILVALGLAFAAIQAFGWEDINAGSVALVAGAAGIGNLVFFALARRLDRLAPAGSESTPSARQD